MEEDRGSRDVRDAEKEKEVVVSAENKSGKDK
jgi:hypothetical protein